MARSHTTSLAQLTGLRCGRLRLHAVIGILNTFLFGIPALIITALLMFFITKANEVKRKAKVT